MSVPGSARNKTAENYRDVVFAAGEIEASYGSEREGIATNKREPTSGLKNRLLLLQLRVIIQALQGLAAVCKSRISKRFSLLRLAQCCTVLRSRWYQIGVKQHRFSVSMPRKSHSPPALYPTKVSGR